MEENFIKQNQNIDLAIGTLDQNQATSEAVDEGEQ